MHQRVTNRVNQQHGAKYHRMEPIDKGRPGADADLGETRGGSGCVEWVSALRSPLLEPRSNSGVVPRGRNWSTRSGEDSFNDDLAAIQAVLADADWSSAGAIGDKNQNKIEQRLGAFPTSLPSLLTSPHDAFHLSSTTNFSSPPRQRLRIYLDGKDELDMDGGESMVTSVYDNCASTYQSQTLDENGASDQSWHSTTSNSKQDMAKKQERPHSVVTFVDQVAPENLAIPEQSYYSLANRRKSGAAGPSATPTLSPDGTMQYNVNGARRLSARGRSKSPTPPRFSVNEGSATVDGVDCVLTPDEAPEKKESKAHSGPSSRRTVLMIAGLFVVGLILILSGIIVLTVEHHTAFRVAGCSFMGLGVTFFIICLILQRKNVKKLVNQLENDLYFLNVTDNKIWNMIFHFDEQLRW